MGETVMLGVANEGEKSFSIEELKTWEPKNITKVGDIVYFSHNKVFYTVKRIVFDQIFNK